MNKKWDNAVASRISDSTKNFSSAMRRRRKDRKIPMRVISEKTGITLSHLSRIETAQVTPTLTTVEKIAAALGTSAAILLSAASRAETPDTEYLKRIVASNLRQAREGRGLSRRQLAEPIGFFEQYIGTTELAKRLPNVRNIVRLAQGLQIQPSELLKETFDPNCLEAPRVYEYITRDILAQRVKQRRIEQGLAREKVCVGMNKSSDTLYSLERGTRWPASETLIALSIYYACSVSKFIDL